MSASAATLGRAAAVRSRPMTPTDLDAVVGLDAAVGTRSWSRRTFEGELAAPSTRRYIVAEVTRDEEVGSAGEVVGFAGMHLIADEAHITKVCVHPSERCRGVATRLIATLLEGAARGGACAATLEVRAGNTAARALYRRLGFTDEGLRPSYYPDGEDAVIMWRRADAVDQGQRR